MLSIPASLEYDCKQEMHECPRLTGRTARGLPKTLAFPAFENFGSPPLADLRG